MTKTPDRWPLWKIVAAALGCAAVGGVLLWLSTLAGKAEGDPMADPARPRSALSLSGFLMILGTGSLLLSGMSLVWLGYRIYLARVPAWKRGGKKKRR
jgi:hypothetical protein